MNIATAAMDVAWKDTRKNVEQTGYHAAEVLRLFPNILNLGKLLPLKDSFREEYQIDLGGSH